MADEISAVQAIKKFSGQHQTRLRWWLAYAGDGNGNVYTSQANYYLCRYPLTSSPAVEIYNNRVGLVDGLRIIVGYTAYQPNLLQVLDVADQRLDGVDPNDNPINPGEPGYVSVLPHWVNHQYMGPDSGLINFRQLSSLGVFPNYPADLNVRIWPGTIPRPGTDVNVSYQLFDLTASVPPNGARYTLISFDSTGAVVATDGTINAGGFAALTNADIPDTPAGNWRSCAVVLYDGQTAIVETHIENDFLDLRFPEESPATLVGHVIEEEGTPLTQRSKLNFIGTYVTATDDAGNDATLVTVTEPTGVDIASDSANITAVNFLEDGKPAAPAASHRIIYAKSTGIYVEDSAGAEVGPLGASPALALNDLTDVNTAGEATGDVIYDNAGTWIPYPLGIGTRITVSGTKIRFGNVAGGNYLEIDSVTGTLRLAGDATTWDDFRVEASIVKAGATAPQYKAFGPSGNLQALMFEAGHHDEAMFEMQMPHNWKLGTNIYPHVHWTPTTADAGNVVWELEYAWCNIGDTFGAPSNMASDATAAGGTAWVHKLTYLKSGGNNYIDATGKTLSSMLVCRIHRNSNSGSDTLNKDVALLEVDFHYQIDSLGSDEELVKDASASLLLETGDILLLETGNRLLLE